MKEYSVVDAENGDVLGDFLQITETHDDARVWFIENGGGFGHRSTFKVALEEKKCR